MRPTLIMESNYKPRQYNDQPKLPLVLTYTGNEFKAIDKEEDSTEKSSSHPIV